MAYSESRQISEFNESAYQINRIHNHLQIVASYREKGEFHKVRWKLDSIEMELRYDAKKIDDADKTIYIKRLNEINIKLRDAVDNRNSEELYSLLMNKETLLREIQQESGKGTRYRDPDEDDLD